MQHEQEPRGRTHMTEDTTPTMRRAYEFLKRAPVDPNSIYGSASGSATTNSQKSEEDDEEEAKKQLKALALFRVQKRTGRIDPPYSAVEKEYERLVGTVFTSRAPENVDDTRQTSSGVPHGPD